MAGIGLALSIAGTFLPWVVSGGVERNSYAIAGIVRRIGLLGDGLGDSALSLWPVLGPLAVVPVITGIVGWWRTAAVLSSLFGLLVGLVGGAVLAVASGRGAAGIALDPTGPVVTVVGAVLTLSGSVALIALGRRRRQPAESSIHVSTKPDSDSSRPTHEPYLYRSQ